MKIGKFSLLLFSLIVLPVFCLAGTISPQLQAKLDNSNPSTMHKVIVVLSEQADIYALDDQLRASKSTLAERNYQVISALQDAATRTQPPVLAEVDKLQTAGEIKNVKTFWLANLIAFEGTQSAITMISNLPNVQKITIDYPIELIDPIENIKPLDSNNLITSVEQGLAAIHAPEAWALGYTGAGRVVSNIDTGVDGTHPALAARFRGDVDGDGDVDESWYDPYDTHWTYPQDSGSHGTHTMGTICGRTPDGDTIGVAIDAQWIASPAIDRGGGIERTASDALLAFQWIADPDGNPLTQDNPDACGNSWGIPDGAGYPDCDETFWVAIDNCEAAGTVVIFSAGNESSSGLRSPADRATTYYNCFSVGAIDAADPSYPIAYFSALGPTECATGDLAIKPEVVAPGVNVRSSVPGGGYAYYSGTSMASPHVTGSVAVIRQANPNLDANTIKEILMTTAEDLPFDSPDGEDNTFGHGIINLYQAVLYAEGFGNVDGTVTDASTLQPIPAKISVVGLQIQTYANVSGYYIFGLPADTSFTLEASYFGYLPQQQSVTVVADDTVTQNFSLTLAPTAVLEGTVTSVAGDSIAGAEVTILNTPIASTTTNADGYYQFPAVPSGSSYDVRVRALGYSQGLASIYIEDGVINTRDFSLWPAESFEINNGGYSGSGVWEWGTPTYGPSGAWSGTKLWGTVLDGQYDDGVDDNLISPEVTISSPVASLEFYHWYEIENSYDGGNVAISTNGGIDWAVLTPDGGYPDADISAFGNLEPGYTGTSDWTVASFDLSAYYNQNVMFRWRFGSDGSVVGAGWYIDDVVVIGATPPEPPDMSYDPTAYNVSTSPGNFEVRNLNITNDGDGPLYFTLAAETYNPLNGNSSPLPILSMKRQLPDPIGYHPASLSKDSKAEPYYPPVITDQGGPDEYGYEWTDSNEPGGPTYSWVDITSTGTPIAGLGDDTNVGPYSIGFTFNYYGIDYSTFRFCTNGFISFTSTSAAYSNIAMPSTSAPLAMLAAFWDDLNFNDGGTAYYYTNNTDSLVVSWVDVAHYSAGGPYTFQIILLGNDKIVYQYQSLADPLNSATVAIQNEDGTIGLQTAYNADYLQNGLAIEYAAAPNWLTVSPASAIVPPHDSYIATVRFDAADLPIGIYNGNINMLSNDPVQPDVDIPVTFNVGSGGTPDMSYAPTSITTTLSPYTQENHTIMLHNQGDGTLSVTFSTAASWIQFASGPRYVAPDDSTAFAVTINTDGVAPGTYNGTINFASNDPDLPTGNIPVSLTVLAPALSFEPSSIADSLAQGEQASHQVTFYNDGDGTLALNFTSNDSWIEFDLAPTYVDPHDSGILQFTLNASALTPGMHNGTIGFTSNDPSSPDGTIPVQLYIYEPNIVVNPAAIGDTLETDEQSSKNLYVQNTGAGTLTYTVNYQTFNPLAANTLLKSTNNPVRTAFDLDKFTTFSDNSAKKGSAPAPIGNPPVITNQGGPDAFGYWWIDSNEPGGPAYSWIDISTVGTPITALADDENSGPYPIGFNFPFYDNIFDSFRFCTNGFISFTSTSNAWQNALLPTGGEPVNLISPLWDDLYFPGGGSAYFYSNNSDSLIVSWVGVPHFNSGGPYTFQVIILANGKIVFQYQDVNDPANSNTVGVQNGDGTIGLPIAYESAYIENNLAVELRSGTWLSVTPTAGSVEPYGTDTLHVDFNATGLEEGSYLGQISIASNDPETPAVDVPANLEVGLVPMPLISLNITSVTDTVFSGYAKDLDLVVSNVGLLDLTYSITDNRSWITEDPAGGTIIPGATDSVTLTLDGTTLPPGNYTGTITVSSNDPTSSTVNIPVQLVVIVATIPEMEMSPLSFEITVMEGDIFATEITIGNIGNGTLTYTLTDNRTWITMNPENGSVAEGEPADTIAVTFDATSLTQGNYAGMITCSSNDPNEATVNIDVILHVITESACNYTPGDVNGDGNVIGSDVTYAVTYFRGGANPPDSCQLNNGDWLYTAADANGDCRFIGSDVTYLVNFFRGSTGPQYCAEVPPAGQLAGTRQPETAQPAVIIPPAQKEITGQSSKK